MCQFDNAARNPQRVRLHVTIPAAPRLDECKRKHYRVSMPKEKNVHAVALSKGWRWKKKTKAQRSAHMKMMALKRWADYRRAEAALAEAEKAEETP